MPWMNTETSVSHIVNAVLYQFHLCEPSWEQSIDLQLITAHREWNMA